MNQKEPSIPAQVGIGALIVAAFVLSFNGLALFFEGMEMGLKFTPGPWSSGKEIPLTAKANDTAGFSLVFVNRDNKEEVEANARLIAAAPDLLEALIKAQEDINWMLNTGQHLNGHCFDYIEATIAKATGEQK